MLDIALIREKPDWVKEQLRKLNDPSALARIDAILDLDQQRRALLVEVEAIKANRNRLNKQMGHFRSNKQLSPSQVVGGARAAIAALEAGNIDGFLIALENPIAVDGAAAADVQAAFDDLAAALKNLGSRVTELDAQIREVDAALEEQMLWVPNMPHSSVPVGLSEEENIIHPVQGEMRAFDFEPLPHWELGPRLGVIDFERGVKLAGTRFYILEGMGARLYRAMIAWLLDVHTTQHGYTEIYPPFMVQEAMMYGSAQFPKFRDVVYFDQESQLYMLPTAEVALTNMHRDEILDEAQLPLYYAAHTPCFRREKMSAGRDVRGIKRGHQFDKVEMYIYCKPEDSAKELEKMVADAEQTCEQLGLTYRRVQLCTGDLGFNARITYDIEVWAPGCQEWLEVSSVSNVGNFQARRANIKYVDENGRKDYLHTLNGSGLGMPRTMIGVLETYQQADGSIRVPEVLKPWMGGLDVITGA